MANPTVLWEIDGRGVATVTLNRPEVNNAYNGDLIDALHAAMDDVIAADDAIFSIAETRWGLMASIIIPQLADAMGVRQLRRYALTAERFDAHEARRIGLVHEVVPVADLAAAGARLVDHVLRNAP